MALLREIRRRARQVAPQVAAASMVAYFAFHAVQGDRGFLAYLRLSRELQQAQAVEADVAAERAKLEKRVALLRPDGLDRDMLDERARQLLDYGRPGDMVIFLSPDGDSDRSGQSN